MIGRLAPIAGLALAALLAVSGHASLGLGLHAGFVLAGAAPIGAVLLMAIARLTGAAWPVDPGPPGALWWLAALGAVAMLAPDGAAIPPHLAIWSHPIAVAARAAVATAGLAWAGGRLAGGAGPGFAGATLAVYAWLVTPVAADWLLPTAPAHPVSAVGMMLFLLQFAAGCGMGAWRASGRARRDLSLLLVAAILGLCYLVFMDYLIVWYGNLPARVPFYLNRAGWLAATSLAIGLGGTTAFVSTGRATAAALSAAAGLVLFVLWWIGGSLVTVAVALAVLAGTLSWRQRHG